MNKANSLGISTVLGLTVWGMAATASASPTVCDVTDATDDIGVVGSLRYCVDQVNQGNADTLNVNPDWYELQSPLVFERSATVHGSGSIVMPGDEFSGDSLIEVGTVCPGPSCAAPATVDLQGLEIGAVGFTGVRGIDVKKSSELVMWGTLMVGFEVPTEGGCIRALQGATVTVHNAAFEECKADDGGAIWSSGATSIYDTTFENNEAAYNGGAIRVDGSGFHVRSLDVEGGEFIENRADRGGAISGVHSKLSVSVLNSDFVRNAATSGGAVRGEGDFEQCRFDSNEAKYKGGALYIVEKSRLLDSSIYGSRANEGAGAAVMGTGVKLSVDGSTFAHNFAEAADGGGGGGLLLEDGTAIVRNSTFSENYAHSPMGNATGGAVAVRGQGDLEAVHVTMAENSSDYAGGIAAEANTKVVLFSSVVAYSKADDCDIAGAFTTESSVDTDGTCNVKWTDPKLTVKPLTNNGGLTETRFVTSAQQLDAMCFDVEDQRDEPRGSGSSCDPGAVELQ